MKKDKWSEYDKYVVLSEKSKCAVKGTYATFQNFKTVLEIVRRISHTDNTSYLHEGNIYSRKVTSTDATKILLDVLECRWNRTTAQMKLIASQLGVII
tara:strand:- start:28 stop:321 length:294 start_codon:yes stop_codon:yes gene_type:complete